MFTCGECLSKRLLGGIFTDTSHVNFAPIICTPFVWTMVASSHSVITDEPRAKLRDACLTSQPTPFHPITSEFDMWFKNSAPNPHRVISSAKNCWTPSPHSVPQSLCACYLHTIWRVSCYTGHWTRPPCHYSSMGRQGALISPYWGRVGIQFSASIVQHLIRGVTGSMKWQKFSL